MEAMDIEQIATAFRRCAYNAYSNVLIGNAPKVVRDAYERMKEPRAGDWVIETSTIGGMRHKDGTDLDGIGILEKAARENVVFDDPDFAWDEEVEGMPHPTEIVYYIRTMDGMLFRWTNASIIAIQSELVSMFSKAT